MLHEKLARSLKRKKNFSLAIDGYVNSAVLVPLVFKKGQYEILFTQRTDRVRDHKNQISFPGGVTEKKDRNPLETALRESEEELGLPPQKVEILGPLDEIFTPTRYRIFPFVGLVRSTYALKPNPEEIRRIITIPLKHLCHSDNVKIDTVDFFDRRFDIPYFSYRNHLIWGATGRITLELVQLVQKYLPKG